MSPSRTSGFTLVEAVVSVLLTCLVGGLALRAFVQVRAGTEVVVASGSSAGGLRVARSVLRHELTTGAPGVDWVPEAPDSVRLRAFRATAVACGPPVDSSVVVAVSGGRAVDPGKDSLLVLGADGTWVVADLVGRSLGATCPRARHPGGAASVAVERWSMSPLPEDPVLLRAFETGSYHFAAGALRYRSGASGRQPLTEAVLTGVAFRDSAGVFSVEVPADGASRRIVVARAP